MNLPDQWKWVKPDKISCSFVNIKKPKSYSKTSVWTEVSLRFKTESVNVACVCWDEERARQTLAGRSLKSLNCFQIAAGGSDTNMTPVKNNTGFLKVSAGRGEGWQNKIKHKLSLTSYTVMTSSSSSGSLMNTEKQTVMNKNTLAIGKAFTQHGGINKTRQPLFH